MEDKNIRIGFNIWALLSAKATELTIRTGKTTTIKELLEKAVLKDLSPKKEKEEI
ncbi:unnamed protein product [marine sediment metagenome]|uniref:Uncharacterized protein n=1 Tax=marine sediment metagenome TaxID=412755 RepID=X0ZZA5_9ZZZZ